MSAILKTLVIAGHEITLEVGRRYVAKCPRADACLMSHDIRIIDIDGNTVEMIPADLDLANAFLAEFNNGIVSTDGRIWR